MRRLWKLLSVHLVLVAVLLAFVPGATKKALAQAADIPEPEQDAGVVPVLAQDPAHHLSRGPGGKDMHARGTVPVRDAVLQGSSVKARHVQAAKAPYRT